MQYVLTTQSHCQLKLSKCFLVHFHLPIDHVDLVRVPFKLRKRCIVRSLRTSIVFRFDVQCNTFILCGNHSILFIQSYRGGKSYSDDTNMYRFVFFNCYPLDNMENIQEFIGLWLSGAHHMQNTNHCRMETTRLFGCVWRIK